MNKLIITRWKGNLLTALYSDGRILELGLEEESSTLGNIYVGKIKRIVKNLNSAFVDFGEGKTGYYSLDDNPVSLYANGFPENEVPSQKLKNGDEIIVQVIKEATKSKDPVLASNLNFTGKYAVLTMGKKTIGFSNKIHDKNWKERLRPDLDALLCQKAGVIVRTNGYEMDQALLEEIRYLMEASRQVLKTAAYRTGATPIYQAEPEYLKTLKGCYKGTLDEILTDEKSVFETIKEYLNRYPSEGMGELRYYEDPFVSLPALYSLKTVTEQACQKRVWLKSGGYLVIEPTEAMVVIDVNTGKYSGKKNVRETIRMINLEAAQEICRQLRLRNLSGIIMVDFIDMKEEEDKEALMEALRCYALQDPVKTTVVDMTQLNLVELTRKKGKKPLWEQLAATKG
ncbi:MAG: ribonuclease E/G [Lachnospiraceae bacterium]|nr:ribonuclease E/G [Lachnospiraceae bacterium]